jgi:hypothetical protein
MKSKKPKVTFRSMPAPFNTEADRDRALRRADRWYLKNSYGFLVDGKPKRLPPFHIEAMSREQHIRVLPANYHQPASGRSAYRDAMGVRA